MELTTKWTVLLAMMFLFPSGLMMPPPTHSCIMEGEYSLNVMKTGVSQCIDMVLVPVDCTVNTPETTTATISPTVTTTLPPMEQTVNPSRVLTSATTSNTKLPTCTVAPQTPADPTSISLNQLYPYITAIGVLFGLILCLGVGWVYTCIVLKLRMRKIRIECDKKMNRMNMEFSPDGAGMTVNSLVLRQAHNYERMQSTDADSDYNLLSRDNQSINGVLITQQVPVSNLPPDYEYNRLDNRHDYHELDTGQNRESRDYDYLDETDNVQLEGPQLRVPRPQGSVNNYHVLEGPHTEQGVPRPQGTSNNYHVLEGPQQGVPNRPQGTLSPQQPSRPQGATNNYHVLEGPGLANETRALHNRENDYYVLEGPGLANTANMEKENSHNTLESPSTNADRTEMRKANSYHILEGSFTNESLSRREGLTESETSSANVTPPDYSIEEHQAPDPQEEHLLDSAPIERTGTISSESEDYDRLEDLTELSSEQKTLEEATVTGNEHSEIEQFDYQRYANTVPRCKGPRPTEYEVPQPSRQQVAIRSDLNDDYSTLVH